jgi:antitoxin (DNA-binding transcriptional repressor) of toxin-antitoxin stability system
MSAKGGHCMATAIDIRELPARLDEALALASAGCEVILLDGSVLRARLVPFAPAPSRDPGLHPRAIQPASDFDAPLPEEFWTGQT